MSKLIMKGNDVDVYGNDEDNEKCDNDDINKDTENGDDNDSHDEDDTNGDGNGSNDNNN